MFTRNLLARSRKLLTKAGSLISGDAPAVQAFYLLRLKDVNGHSGEGVVAQGIVYPNGWVSMCWLTDTASVTFYESIGVVKALHGHEGASRVIMQTLAVIAESEL